MLIDIEVANGILNAYNRAEKNQSRVYGIILGTHKDNIYHITDVLYGYIFENGEDSTTQQKKYSRLSDENVKVLLNSLYQKFNISSQQKTAATPQVKEKDNVFQTFDTQMILGGFATDRELFGDLHNLYSTIELITDNIFKNINKLILLVDPNFKDQKDLKYGIKTFEWMMKTIKINNKETKRLLSFKEIDSQIVEYLNTVQVLNYNSNDKFNLDNKIYNLEIDKEEKKNINELLELNDGKGDVILSKDSNIDYIKNKVNQAINYLNILEKILGGQDGKEGIELDPDICNQISFILSKLEPVLDNKEIIEELSKNTTKIDNINSLTQLLKIQLNLSDKIQQLMD